MPLTILHIERHGVVAEVVRDALEAEGWRVVNCADGAAALTRLAGGTPYALLITNNLSPHVGGLEVVRRVRRLEHRARLPVVVLTGADCGPEAYRAGADAFLRKPEGLNELIPTVAHLLDRGA